MLPVVPSTTTFTYQTPLVNTVTPGSTVVHTPYDNVAPSVSSDTVENNTKGNSTPPASAPEQITPTVPDGADGFSALLGAGPSSLNAGIPATFIAQLAGQEGSPETQVMLVQYEKMIANSIVKYKPSFAFTPTPEPSSVFGRILQTEKQQSGVQDAAPPPAETPSASTQADVAMVAVPPVPKPARSVSETAESPDPAPAAAASGPRQVIQSPAVLPQFINAYAASASRITADPTVPVPPVTELA